MLLGGVPWFGIAADRYEAPPDVVRCESHDQERVHCTMLTTHGVQLVRQLSVNSCEHGSQWDVDPEGVWVEQGCQAEFAPCLILCIHNGGYCAAPQMVLSSVAPWCYAVSLSAYCANFPYFPARKMLPGGENTMKSGCPVAAKVNLNSVPKMDLDLLICRGA